MYIEVKGMDDLMRGIDGMAVQVQSASERALKATAKTIWTVAKQNAPRSPSSGQIKANRKTNRKTKRKPTATSRPAPGGLERSISYEVFGSKEASIFVPSNSEAGTYAEFIHDCRVPGARPIIRGPRGGEKRAKGPAGTWSKRTGTGAVVGEWLESRKPPAKPSFCAVARISASRSGASARHATIERIQTS